jgi:hypothetical protein
MMMSSWVAMYETNKRTTDRWLTKYCPCWKRASRNWINVARDDYFIIAARKFSPSILLYSFNFVVSWMYILQRRSVIISPYIDTSTAVKEMDAGWHVHLSKTWVLYTCTILAIIPYVRMRKENNSNYTVVPLTDL